MPSAPSLRQFEHIGEIYKEKLLPVDCPRLGEYAEITRICCKPYRGLLVRVVNNPHWCVTFCAFCQLKIKEWIVQVEPVNVDVRLQWLACNPPPYFYPIEWLRRWEERRVGGSLEVETRRVMVLDGSERYKEMLGRLAVGLSVTEAIRGGK